MTGLALLPVYNLNYYIIALRNGLDTPNIGVMANENIFHFNFFAQLFALKTLNRRPPYFTNWPQVVVWKKKNLLCCPGGRGGPFWIIGAGLF
jgi:hypothetical protein